MVERPCNHPGDWMTARLCRQERRGCLRYRGAGELGFAKKSPARAHSTRPQSATASRASKASVSAERPQAPRARGTANRSDQLIAQTLMIAFVMIMLSELTDRPPKDRRPRRSSRG